MNFFCVFTPFQRLVVDSIINQYFNEEENYIVSTVKGASGSTANTIYVGRSLIDIMKVWRLKFFINRNIDVSSFFVPHLGSLFSSYFWQLAKDNKRPINVYYEGVAMFYDPIVDNPKAKKERERMGWLMGIKYQHYSQLYPKEFVEKVKCCYSPTLKMVEKFKDVRLFSFNISKVKSSNNILLLTSDVASKTEMKKCIGCVKNSITDSTQIIYFKPHYALNDDAVILFCDLLQREIQNEVVVLDKFVPIESLYGSLSFKSVICQHFTSALVNLKFIHGEDLQLSVIDEKSILNDIVRSLDINLLTYKDSEIENV